MKSEELIPFADYETEILLHYAQIAISWTKYMLSYDVKCFQLQFLTAGEYLPTTASRKIFNKKFVMWMMQAR